MKSHFLIIPLVFCLLLPGCFALTMHPYYRDESNYAEFTGTISFISYDETTDTLYLSFENITPKTADNSFKIVSSNLAIQKDSPYYDKIAVGTPVSFCTAPKYYGDGYIMPLVGLSIDGETLLEKSKGIANWNDWLDKN